MHADEGIRFEASLLVLGDLWMDANADSTSGASSVSDPDKIAAPNSIYINATGSLSLNGLAGEGASHWTLSANDGIDVGCSLSTTSSSSTFSIIADSSQDGTGTLSLCSACSLTTADSRLAIYAADLAIPSGATVDVGTASSSELYLFKMDGASVAVGDSAIADSNSLALFGSEVARITATTLWIGGDHGGIEWSTNSISQISTIRYVVLSAQGSGAGGDVVLGPGSNNFQGIQVKSCPKTV
eukprot:2624351-Rhodomonas_salina.2